MSDEMETRKRHTKIKPYAWYVLGVLLLIYIFNFVDRQILSILAEDIKLDLDLNDAQLGFLYGTAFAIFYALFGIPFGRLADGWRRGALIAIGLVIWSSMTALSGFATTFALLAVARIGVGIGEATAAPASYSMISSYFPPERRATALSIYASGLYIGTGLSLPIGGFILSRWNAMFPDPNLAPLGLVGWQAAFIAVGLPGLLLALWVLSLKDPGREPEEEIAPSRNVWREFLSEIANILPPLTLFAVAKYPGELRKNLVALAVISMAAALLILALSDAPQWIAYALGVYAVFSWVQTLKYRDPPTHRLIWSDSTVLGVTFAFGTIAFVTYATAFWAPPYALRTFYSSSSGAAIFLGNLTAAEEVATFLGAGSAIASAVGVVIGGMIADHLRKKHAGGRLFVCIGAIVLSAPFVFAMFTTNSPKLFYLIAPVAVALSSSWSGAAIATLQDAVLPRMRATAGATFILAITMVGLALGPYLVGKIATVSGEIRLGVFSLYLAAPLSLYLLWRAARRIGFLEESIVDRARSAGEQ